MANIKINELVPGLVLDPAVYFPGSIGTETFKYSAAQIAALAVGSTPLGGDVDGPASMATVVALQGVPISNAAPANGQFLRFNGSNWQPETVPLESIYLADGSLPVATTRVMTIPANSNLEMRNAANTAFVKIFGSSETVSLGGKIGELIGTGSYVAADGNKARFESGVLNGIEASSSTGIKVFFSTTFKFEDTSVAKLGAQYSADNSATIRANARSIPDVGTVKSIFTADGGISITDDGDFRKISFSAAGGTILNGGNSFGAPVVIGSNDDFGIDFETNGVVRFSISQGLSSAGTATFTASSSLSGTPQSVVVLRSNTSATPGVGFGGSLVYQAESSTTENRDLIAVSAAWKVATDATRTAEYSIYGTNNGTAGTVFARLGPLTAGGEVVLKIGAGDAQYSDTGITGNTTYAIRNSGDTLKVGINKAAPDSALHLVGVLTAEATSGSNAKYIKIVAPSGGGDAIEIGRNATTSTASSGRAIAIGTGASAVNSNASHGPIAIGYGAVANSNYGLAIGLQADSGSWNSIALGRGAFPSSSSQFVIGQNTLECQINELWLNGVNSNSGQAAQAVSFNMNRATGTDQAGADMTFNAGVATGTGTGGDLVFRTTTQGSTGSIRQSHTERVRIKWNTGLVGFGTASPSARVDVNHSVGYNQLRLRTSYTPTATADGNGSTGDFAWDDSYIYLKTSAGWKRASIATF